MDKSGPMPDDQNQSAFLALVKSLPEDDARFVVFDFTESKADGRQIKKLVLIKWYDFGICVCDNTFSSLTPTPTLTSLSLSLYRCPDGVNFRVKPVIGATYQTLKEKLQGLGKDIQASDTSDLEYEAIKKQLAA